MQKTIKKPQEKDFFQSTGHKSVLKKRNESMGIYFGHILLLNWLTCLDETKPKNMFAESVKIWVLKQISSITAHSDQSFNAQRKEKY